jgi:hypothetical protein
MSVTEPQDFAQEPGPHITPEQMSLVRGDLDREGYVQIDGFFSLEQASKLASGIHTLRGHGLLPVFALLYDDYWRLSRGVNGLLSDLLGPGYAQQPDFWCWYLDPTTEERGWSPHRDKGAMESILPDGRPKSLTIWIPLTDVSPLNGCMYIVPAHMDPGYETATIPMAEELLGGVRALPARAGTLFTWNQRVLHWGGSSSRRAQVPRISIAFEFQRGDIEPFNEPLLRSPHGMPSFDVRVTLVAKQILQYTHMYGYDESLVQAAETLADGLY